MTLPRAPNRRSAWLEIQGYLALGLTSGLGRSRRFFVMRFCMHRMMHRVRHRA